MTPITKIAVIVVAAAMLTGCASSTYSYVPPSTREVQTERVLSSKFEEVWDRYVAELSQSFFVINNISKDSRIINVSYSTSEPGEFVDCGKSTRVTNHPAIGQQTYRYDSADDSTHLYGVKGTNNLWRVNRTTRLSGRANIYMAPQGQGTIIRANAKYVWTVDVVVVGSTSNTTVMDFSSRQAASKTQTSEGRTRTFVCRSRGVLERRLLNLISN